MNQSMNTDSKNSKEPQQKYRLGTVSIKILGGGGLNRFYGYPTSPSASIMAQNIQLFGPRGGFLTHQWMLHGLNFGQKLCFFTMKLGQVLWHIVPSLCQQKLLPVYMCTYFALYMKVACWQKDGGGVVYGPKTSDRADKNSASV